MSACSAHRRKRPDIIDCVVYYCGNYDRYGTMTCSSHKLEARDLIDADIADINRWARLTMRSEKASATLQRKLNSVSTNECAELEREKRKLQKRLAELDRLFTALYEDRVIERISRYEDKTGFVECEFQVPVSKGQGKVSDTLVMSTVI